VDKVKMLRRSGSSALPQDEPPSPWPSPPGEGIGGAAATSWEWVFTGFYRSTELSVPFLAVNDEFLLRNALGGFTEVG
jgi:hypothetical protein